jgi:hypothetical protein
MYLGKFVFAQVMDHLPLHTFHRCVARYSGEHKVKRFSCLDQYLCMAFARLTYRESLRDIEACLRAQSSKLYHLGIRGSIARNTLANANATPPSNLLSSSHHLARCQLAKRRPSDPISLKAVLLDPELRGLIPHKLNALTFGSIAASQFGPEPLADLASSSPVIHPANASHHLQLWK